MRQGGGGGGVGGTWIMEFCLSSFVWHIAVKSLLASCMCLCVSWVGWWGAKTRDIVNCYLF